MINEKFMLQDMRDALHEAKSVMLRDDELLALARVARDFNPDLPRHHNQGQSHWANEQGKFPLDSVKVNAEWLRGVDPIQTKSVALSEAEKMEREGKGFIVTPKPADLKRGSKRGPGKRQRRTR